jgi:oxaloacetate decarboxylase alpha subunit
LSDTDIAEFLYESDGTKVAIRKNAAFTANLAASTSVSPTTASETYQPAATIKGPEPEVVTSQEDNSITIVAPMVGTFYRAPSPDAAPYVSVGDMVEVGQPLCIIEAMKLMNEIECEVKGRILHILAENAQPVEYGQPLFVIERL